MCEIEDNKSTNNMNDLTELINIRDKFQASLRDWFDIAHALIATTSIGAETVIGYMQSNPDASYSFAVPVIINEDQSFASINKLSYEEIFKRYFSHKGAITELVYGRIVQQWYDFLNQIIEQVVKDHITGVKIYPKIPKVEVKLDFSTENILEEVPRLIKESFDFKKNYEKTKLLEDCLEQKIDENLKKEIKKAIIVRNILEHNQGFIRNKDLKDTGSNSIKLINSSCQEQDWKSGEKIEITIYELYRLKNLFYHISKQLIPD